MRDGNGMRGVSADAHAGRDWHAWDACALEGTCAVADVCKLLTKLTRNPIYVK